MKKLFNFKQKVAMIKDGTATIGTRGNRYLFIPNEGPVRTMTKQDYDNLLRVSNGEKPVLKRKKKGPYKKIEAKKGLPKKLKAGLKEVIAEGEKDHLAKTIHKVSAILLEMRPKDRLRLLEAINAIWGE